MLTARWEPTNVFTHDSLKARRPASPSLPCRHYAFEEETWLRNRSESPLGSSDEWMSRSDSGDSARDRFMEIAQAALEEANKEEDQKGVIQEMLEALIATAGAQLMAEVIAEQMRSPEVMEQLAANQDYQRQSLDVPQEDIFPDSPKEPLLQQEAQLYFDDDTESDNLVSEYIWRLFRLLFFASVVGLVCHFARAHESDKLS